MVLRGAVQISSIIVALFERDRLGTRILLSKISLRPAEQSPMATACRGSPPAPGEPERDRSAKSSGRDRRIADVVSSPPSGRSSRQTRSEEHTSELQSLAYLVCRLLLE